MLWGYRAVGRTMKLAIEDGSIYRAAKILGATIVATLALSVAGASAAPPKLALYGSFSSHVKETLLAGIAVDNSGPAFAGDVYVANFFDPSGEPPIYKFDGEGHEISPPSPFGDSLGLSDAVDPVNENIDVFLLFDFTHFGTAGPSIAAYRPSDGSFVPSESFLLPNLEPSEEEGIGRGRVLQIGTDSAGNVYVPRPATNKVLEYSRTGVLLNEFTGGTGSGALKGPTAVAVDSSGDLWVADAGDNRIEELSPTDTPVVGGEIQNEGVQTLTLDGHGDVFAILRNKEDFCGTIASPCSHMVEYDASGMRVADVGAGSFGTTSSPHLADMVAVNQTNGRVYVSDEAKEKIWIFGPPLAPVVDKELAVEVTSSEAKLGALVSAGATETTFRFEYGPTSAYGQSTPSPEGSVGEGLTAQAVWAAAGGLAPGTTYHYRVVATNALGTVAGPDQTFTTPTTEQVSCPNEEERGGFSAKLPDCRGYELVAAPGKTSVNITGVGPAAVNGEAIAFDTEEPLANALTASLHYIARRGTNSWSSEDIIPIESYSGTGCDTFSNKALAYSDTFSKALISLGHDSRSSEPGGGGLEKQECNVEGLQVTPGEPVGYQNLLLRESGTGAYRLLNSPPQGVIPADAHFEGASADLSHVVFSERAPLTEGTVFGENLYEWDEGTLRLVSTNGTLARTSAGSISANGSHIFFESGGNLYARIVGERTIEVDASQGPGAGGEGRFQSASADGSKVFFTDESKLTAGSTAEPSEPDLYECILRAGASECELSDLTIAKAGEHADVLHVSLLGNNDSTHVYFTATGVLASNTREYTDSEGNKVVERAQNGQTNLYLWSGGAITFVATVATLVDPNAGAGLVSPDGMWFALSSTKSLTGYDNTFSAAGSSSSVQEIFVYDGASNQLVCASCNPSGEAPSDAEGTPSPISELTGKFARALSNNGRLFFNTQEALLPSDTNGQIDVYEYEHGQLYLISSGVSSRESTFRDASENGNDVFFTSNQSLVAQDINEEALTVYDARVDGGFPTTVFPPSCDTTDKCRAPTPLQPAIYGAPASQTFSGTGNVVPPSRAVKPVKKKKKTVCKRHRRKHRRCRTRKVRRVTPKRKGGR
jgi:hypothetical protein